MRVLARAASRVTALPINVVSGPKTELSKSFLAMRWTRSAANEDEYETVEADHQGKQLNNVIRLDEIAEDDSTKPEAKLENLGPLDRESAIALVSCVEIPRWNVQTA